jgi:hypothetical protein
VSGFTDRGENLIRGKNFGRHARESRRSVATGSFAFADDDGHV